MKNIEVETKIKQAFEHAVPDVLDKIVSDCSEQKGMIVTMKTTNNRTRKWTYRALGLAAAFVVLAAGIVTAQLVNMKGIDSRISLDVNPSVEIQTNKNDKVVHVEPLNDDGKKIVGDMNFEGSDLEVTVNALVGSMLRNGYLDELSNSILVSVDNGNAEKSAALQKKLTDQINDMLHTDQFDGAVLTQGVDGNKELKELAETYGITVGKAQIISKLIEKNPLYTFEALAPLSVNELNLLRQEKASDMSDVNSVGNASEKAYIGKDKALAIVANDLGTTADKLTRVECEMDYERGTMIYELEFYYNGFEYDYEVNATTGAIVDFDKDRDDDYQGGTSDKKPVDDSGYIGKDKAKKAALKHAGVKEADIFDYECEFDVENGVATYEVEFSSGKYDYDYKVNATSGEIIRVDTDYDDEDDTPAKKPANTTNKTTASYIGKGKAKEIALKHAGVSADKIRDYECELDDDDKVVVYEIEFSCNGYDYEYEVNAKTGTIRHSDKERDD